jgi:cobalt/nickel transport system permease protein
MTAAPALMHIPDGFLSAVISVILWIVTIAGLAIALIQSRKQLGDRMVPMMGVLGAFIFAAQALNFPVAGGTSGHLIGATLAAIVLGPWPAVLVMTSVVSVQALLFQDGGLVVLGANLLNMAILAPLVGGTLYRLIIDRLGDSLARKLTAAFIAAWTSVVLAAIATALELAASGTVSAALVLPVMTWIHMAIGLGEGLITVGAAAFLDRVRPDLLQSKSPRGAAVGTAVISSGLLIAIIAALFSPIASGDPDGLERVAEQLGFLDTARDPAVKAFGDYVIPIIANPAISTILAVALGLIVVFLVGLLVGRLAARKTDI